LHFLLSLRKFYVSSTGDPFFAHDSHQPWFQIFLYIEGLVQLPLAAYLVSQLASNRGTSGPAELAGLAFGSVTFMGAAACCFELLHMGDDMVSEDKKASLLYGTYLPFAVIRKFPSLLLGVCFTLADECSCAVGCGHVSATLASGSRVWCKDENSVNVALKR
jgi:hypothetical protein